LYPNENRSPPKFWGSKPPFLEWKFRLHIFQWPLYGNEEEFWQNENSWCGGRGILRKLSLCYSVVYCYNGNKVPAVLTGRTTISGFDHAWFKSVSSERIFSLHGAYIVIFFGYIFFFTFSWAWWDWPGWLTIFLQYYDTVGWVIRPVQLSPKWPTMCRGRTLNPTISYRTAHPHLVKFGSRAFEF